MNYHPFATIDTNGGFETLWYKFCILNNKRKYNFSQRIKYKTKKVNPVRNSSPAIAGLETERGIKSR